jgi:hypothetical protein
MQRRWIFGDPIIVTAILDRLPRRATNIDIRGISCRRKRRGSAGLKPGRDEGGGRRQSVLRSPPRLRPERAARGRASLRSIRGN